MQGSIISLIRSMTYFVSFHLLFHQPAYTQRYCYKHLQKLLLIGPGREDTNASPLYLVSNMHIIQLLGYNGKALIFI